MGDLSIIISIKRKKYKKVIVTSLFVPYEQVKRRTIQNLDC